MTCADCCLVWFDCVCARWLAAVLYIQRVYRAWVVRQELQERRYAAEDIQALFRGYAQRKRYGIAQKRVVVLQRYGRGWLARRWFRPALREYRRQLGAVARVQALWRGKMIRHEARIRESEWLMARLAPAAAAAAQRRRKQSKDRPDTPPGVRKAREMVERQVRAEETASSFFLRCHFIVLKTKTGSGQQP